MIEPKNAFEIFKLLKKSNDGEKTCLAFAGAEFKRRRRIAEYPQLDPKVIARDSEGGDSSSAREPEDATHCQKLKDAVAGIDLEASTNRVRGHVVNDRQTFKVLGKNFGVERHGNFYADIFVNSWIAIPFLTYIIFGKGLAPSSRWVSFC
jgi:hypothetical protein